MIFFLEGNEQLLIDQKIASIEKKHKIDEIIHYAMPEATLDMIILEICSSDIFGNKKMIILKDILQVSEKEFMQHLSAQILATMAQSDNVLVLQYERVEPLTKTLEKTFSELFTHAKRINVRQQDTAQVTRFINQLLTEVQHDLTAKDMQLIAEKYKNDLTIIQKEIQQLLLEKSTDQQPNISLQDFLKDSSDFIEEQVFDLIKYIDAKDPIATFKLLDNVFLHQQNIFGILALMLKNYKEMYQIHALKAVGYSFSQIAKRLTIHEFRVKKLWQSSKNIKKEAFPQILHLLIASDTHLKSGHKPEVEMQSLFLQIFALI